MNITVLDVEFLSDPEAFNAAYAQVPAWRKRKVDAIKHQAGKALSLGAGLLLHQAFVSMGLTEPDEALFNEHEKPYYKEYPNIYFSLSHSGTKVMCVIADKMVGCDVEQIKPRKTDIAKRYFAPQEYNLIQSQPTDKDKEEMFFRIWTLKESFLKCIGTGISIELNSFWILPSEDNIIIEQFIFENDGDDFEFEELQLEDGYRYAVCIKK